MYLIEQKSCNLLPQIEKKKKNENKCRRVKVQNRGEKKMFFKKVRSYGLDVAINEITICRRKKKSRKTQDFNRNN